MVLDSTKKQYDMQIGVQCTCYIDRSNFMFVLQYTLYYVCMYVPLLKSYYSSHCYLEMVSTRLHENHETAQILSQSLSLGAKLNWLLLFMHKFIALQPNYNNVTWTNNFNSDDKSVRRILHALSLSVVTRAGLGLFFLTWFGPFFSGPVRSNSGK